MEPPPECDDGDVRVVAAIDKFRGTATAADAAAAVCRGAAQGRLGVRRASHGRWRRGHARRAGRSEPPHHGDGSTRRRGRRRVAAGAPHGGDRDGACVGVGTRRRRGGQRSDCGVDPRHGRAHRGGARGGSESSDRRCRWLRDDRRRARGAPCDLPAGASSGRRDVGRLRRAHEVRRCGRGVRAAEGRDARAGRAAAPAARAARADLHRGLRRRRPGDREQWRRGRARGGLAAIGAQPRLRVRSRRERDRAARRDRGGGPRHHR